MYPMNDEWNELEELMNSDPRATALSMGVDLNTMTQLARLREMEPFVKPEYTDSDIGNARVFADFCRDRLCWMTERKSWFVYENGVWQKDDGGLMAMSWCKQLVMLMQLLAGEMTGPLMQAAFKRVYRLTRRGVRETLLRDAQDLMRQSLSGFDSDPWLFNCQNGTIDLRTGSLRPHDPADRITAMADVRYEPLAVCPRWEQFVDEIMSVPGETQTSMEGDETREKAVYLQKLMGYALTGDTSRECMYMFYGPSTRNGKGTLVETISRMMGTYARAARPETLAAGGNLSGSAPNEDVARLRGARFVAMSEPDYGQRLNVALIKRITGNDTITARFLHENSFEYRPEFKIFLSTNHLLSVTDPTLFASGRLKILTFERHFGEKEQDKGLKETFARPEALSAVLNWCLEGLRLYLQNGLEMPKSLHKAVREYEMDVDVVAQFMEECMTYFPGAKTKTSAMYARFQKWTADNGYPPENIRWFKRMLSAKGTVVRGRSERGGTYTTVMMDWRITA